MAEGQAWYIQRPWRPQRHVSSSSFLIYKGPGGAQRHVSSSSYDMYPPPHMTCILLLIWRVSSSLYTKALEARSDMCPPPHMTCILLLIWHVSSSSYDMYPPPYIQRPWRRRWRKWTKRAATFRRDLKPPGMCSWCVPDVFLMCSKWHFGEIGNRLVCQCSKGLFCSLLVLFLGLFWHFKTVRTPVDVRFRVRAYGVLTILYSAVYTAPYIQHPIYSTPLPGGSRYINIIYITYIFSTLDAVNLYIYI